MARAIAEDKDGSTRDLAARAAWLSLVQGLTQDQIAQELGISRQRAQRLVARAGAEGMVRVRIDHPIAECLELERALKTRYGLERAWVAPRLGEGGDAVTGLAPFTAPILERLFQDTTPQTFAFGTGRTLRAVIEQMQAVDGARHRLVSLIGNVGPDGSASFYEVIMRVADKTGGAHYPMAIPVFARTPDELTLYRSLPHVKAARDLAEAADMAIVGMGQMSDTAPLHVDGFISASELAELRSAGAIGEICGHIFDRDGRFLDHPLNNKSVGVRVPVNRIKVFCIAAGASKLAAIRGALAGNLLDSLVTDEETAQALLRG
ncbi:sugar-binding transcriptional regulator [Pseudooceanicola sp. C21-150M6]|uniref:sugar-binding transcriptional regulator n=1 Tax=Pseudooceanicola sp. C21-150M6 TaxID=3434355 RepID=UPI003D7F83B0